MLFCIANSFTFGGPICYILLKLNKGQKQTKVLKKVYKVCVFISGQGVKGTFLIEQLFLKNTTKEVHFRLD